MVALSLLVLRDHNQHEQGLARHPHAAAPITGPCVRTNRRVNIHGTQYSTPRLFRAANCQQPRHSTKCIDVQGELRHVVAHALGESSP
jgi:hypothetical protein